MIDTRDDYQNAIPKHCGLKTADEHRDTLAVCKVILTQPNPPILNCADCEYLELKR